MTIEAMAAFNEQHFEKKLTLLKDSQESIQALSTWCLQHRQHHKKIVTAWHKVLKKVKLDHRLTLFYLANDVIQYSKRRNYEFVESWGTALQRATTMVRDEKVKEKILRIFKIWGERGIYDETFISDLCGLMSTPARKRQVEAEPVEVVPDPMDFHSSDLFVKIRSCHRLEDDTDLQLKKLNESHKVFTDADALRCHLKDRRHGEDVVAEVDEGGKMMEAYMAALAAEIKERRQLIEELDLAEKFYDTQQGDARLVVSAYKNFGSRVKNLKRHLDERLATYACPSPIPSPDINAPSPSPDCDIELPEDTLAAAQSQDQSFASFLGNSMLPFDFQKNLFNDPFEEHIASEGKPIEVINNRSETEMESSINNFLKSLGNLANRSPIVTSQSPVPDPYTYAAPIPPPPLPPSLFSSLPNKFPTWEEEEEVEPWEELDGETPESPPMCEKESFSVPVEYDDTTPQLDVDHRTDVDHRLLRIPLPVADVDHRVLRKKDVDHRNLISLTGSPSQEAVPRPPLPPWPVVVDQDYRGNQPDVDYRMPPPPPPPPPPPAPAPTPTITPAPVRITEETRDNVESVDMDLSDDENVEQTELKKEPIHNPITFNFNNSTNKPLVISPLNEAHEGHMQVNHQLSNPGHFNPSRGVPPPSLMNRPPFRPPGPPPGAPRSLLSMPLLRNPRAPLLQNPPPHAITPPPSVKMQPIMDLIDDLTDDAFNEDKFLDDIESSLEFPPEEEVGNGFVENVDVDWNVNGREQCEVNSNRPPLLQTPSNEPQWQDSDENVEHWQEDNNIPPFNDWSARSRGNFRGGFQPRGSPRPRGGPRMGRPMRRPFGGRPGPRAAFRPFLPRPGSYGSW